MFLLLAALARADDSFFLGAGDERVSMAQLLRGGVVTGRTGALLVKSRDADALARRSEVHAVVRLAGGVTKVLPRPGIDDLALARALHGSPGVEWVNPVLVLALRPASTPDDPLYGAQWHLENTGQGGRVPGVDIDAPTAWAYATGKGQVVAVIDTGVQLGHPDLAVIPGHDYIDRDDDPSAEAIDGGPHGTGVAGIAAALGDNAVGVTGVAYDADIYAIRLIGGNTTTEDVYDAFIEATDAGAGVINNSWGYYGCDPIPALDTFREMFNYANANGRDGLGTSIVFAAGNDGCDNSNNGMLGNGKVISVAALEWTDERASYSNFGTNIEIAAPTGLLTTDEVPGGYGNYGGDDAYCDGFSGTSGASPVVAGTIALMMEANPRITAKQVREILCETAVRNAPDSAEWNDDGWSPYYGCGRVDAGAAVAAVYNRAPMAPVPTLLRAEVQEGRAILAWEPAFDADGDVQEYEVAWWRDGDEDAATAIATTGSWIDLGAELAVSDAVSWRVRAHDPWGPGDWSVTSSFTVLAAAEAPDPGPPDGEIAPEPKESPSAAACASAAPGSGAASMILAYLAVRGRPRRQG
jgi:subtilisin family serine protease